MSWERDPLLSKAKLYFERAFDHSRDDPLFGLWCSFGLELLARAAVASVSPTLLAEPDPNHRFLLHALNRGSAKTPPRSISTSQVISLCRTLFKEFGEQEASACLALTNRRNDELHSGIAAFEEYQPKHWLAGFYRSCNSLALSMGESMVSLFGEEEAKIAEGILLQVKLEVRQRVESTIAAHRRVFDEKPEDEKIAIAERVKTESEKLAGERHHKVNCPACGCVATVQGEMFGRANVVTTEDEIVVKRSVLPERFICSACGTKLEGYAELESAQLGHYTRTVRYTPEEYYGLIHPDDLDIDQFIRENYPSFELVERGGAEYDNC